MPNMIPQPQTQQPQKKTPKFKKSWIILGVVVLLVIIFIISKVASQPSKSETSSDIPSIPSIEYSSVTSEPDPIVQTSGGALDEITVLDESSFSKSDDAFNFSSSMTFPNASTLADESAITLGKQISFTPMKSCMFKFSTNKVDISHSSGVVMTIQRSSYREKPEYEAVDTTISEKLASGSAEKIMLCDVYLGSSQKGCSGSSVVKINEKDYYMSLTYVFSNDEVITIIAISDIGDEDFIDILYRNINISGQKLTIV